MRASAPTAGARKDTLTFEIQLAPASRCLSRLCYAKDPMTPPVSRNTSTRPCRLRIRRIPVCATWRGSQRMQLSVLSALARQNVDPWEIAQRLTSLPREPAILYLTPLLARTPAGLAAPQDTAARLIAMLLRNPLCCKSWYVQYGLNSESPTRQSTKCG